KDRFYRIDRYDFRGPVPYGLTDHDALMYAKRNLCRVNVRERKRRNPTITIGWGRKWRGLLFGTWPGSYRGDSNADAVGALDDDNGVYGGVHTNASGDFLLASTES